MLKQEDINLLRNKEIKPQKLFIGSKDIPFTVPKNLIHHIRSIF